MANIFISYNREDEDKTKALVNDIEELGHTVWFDHELSGGQKWWDAILESIRNCDILVFALSVESLNSSACSLEYDYASKLGKTILPVLVGKDVSINLLPPVLSQIQFVDYQQPDRNALLHLAKALTSAPPSQPLPDPLSLPPEVPISYLGKLGKQIGNTSKLSYEEQSALLVDLKRGLHDPDTTTDTRTLLQKLRKRQYLFENIAREIDELLEDTVQTTMKTSNKDEVILSETQKKPQKQTISPNTQNNIDQNSGNTVKMILFVIVLLFIAGGAVYFYFNPVNNSNKFFYVCYDEKWDNRHVDKNQIFYKGCKSYAIDCASNGKEHFGRYPSKKERDKALERCISATPKLTLPPEPSEIQIRSVDFNLKQAKAYFYGSTTVSKDYFKAKEYFLKAAKQNSIDAYRYLGTIYLFGNGATVDKKEAKKWLQWAIDSGDMKAQEIYRKYIDNSTDSPNLPSIEVTNDTKYKVINIASNDTLNVRTDPFVGENNKIGELPPHMQNIRVLECMPNHEGVIWCKIESYEGGYMSGWVAKRYISPQNIAKTPYNRYQVVNIRSDDTLAVRNGPGTQYDKIGDLVYSAKGVEIIKCQYSNKGGKWCIVKHDDMEGWVSTTYLRKE